MAVESTDWTVREMAEAVRAGAVSSAELVRMHAERIEALDGSLNAVAVPDLERALERAESADRERARGAVLGPLHGVPFTVKECLEVEGLPLREASLLREPVISRRDAGVVTRLRAAGAIPLGKTNTSELSYFPDTTNRVYGDTRNPHDRGRSASGSSGGEAVAVATGMSAFGIGSDYGGSIRGPAHAVGLFGLRPAPGVIPSAGYAPERQPVGRALWSSVGPLTRRVDDAELVFSSARGPLAASSPGLDLSLPRSVAVLEDAPDHPRGRWGREAVSRAAAALEGMGHELAEAEPPRRADAEWMLGEVTAIETRHMIDSMLRESPDRPAEPQLSPQLAWQWEAVRGLEPDLERYIEALRLRTELEREVDAWLAEHPVAIAPVAATPAHPLGSADVELGSRRVPILELYASCAYASALSLPAAAIPVDRSDEGLPVAVQVIGRGGHEGQILGLARELEEALGGWRPPPRLD